MSTVISANPAAGSGSLRRDGEGSVARAESSDEDKDRPELHPSTASETEEQQQLRRRVMKRRLTKVSQVHCRDVEDNDNDQQQHDDDDYYEINNGDGGY